MIIQNKVKLQELCFLVFKIFKGLERTARD